ncbi:hypothetical protein GCM10009630_20390 [Kribbella jejuensis]|uniref:Uncharacterized protein n=1 Tax=Kribbella jejuensis TaxID=236068 RepID=A0A542EKX3_9ACTN|nr:hypothetical protein [Kribbella jejuensis]TQJ16001.1 hypothetical protein FB475_0087 [Kribbella jejuensis]
MTEPVDESTRRVEQAAADLAELRRQLLRAGEGQLAPAELRASLEAYWHTHRPVLVALATALGEQLRLQTLEALTQWRDQPATRDRDRR